MPVITPHSEATETFACFGTTCSVLVTGSGPVGSPRQAAAGARRRLEHWHAQFSRFDPSSELSRLNADPASTVAVSPMMARFVQAVAAAGERTGGLVDGTLVSEIERAGYAFDLAGEPLPLTRALQAAPPRHPGSPNASARWREVKADLAAGTVSRPAGVLLDSGGVAKGLFTDVLAAALAGYPSFAIDCGGDIGLGGAAGLSRKVRVASPFDDSILHTFELRSGAVATSGIGRRSWLGPSGRPAHHLLDPATGEPAFTGIVQATALAPTGVVAEALAKAAVLSGPDGAARWLPHGGMIVLDDASHRVFAPATP